MKNFIFPFVWGVLVSLLLTACGGRDESKKQSVDVKVSNRDSIQVGMTYDEVEKLLGKPSQIVRGSNQLEMSISSSDDKMVLKDIDRRLRELKFSRAVAETAKGRNVWLFPHVVQTIGQLIYVNWVYSYASADTNYVWVQNYETKTETLSVVDAYIVNGSVVEKKMFDSFKEGQPVYRSYHLGNWIISWSDWWDEKKERPGDVSEPKPAKKEIRYIKKLRQSLIPQEPIKKFFVVTKLFSVIFDASSGRVVRSEFQPFYVNEIN